MGNLLDRCAKEPIHIPGAIQPHGSLLAAEADSKRITTVADNISHYLGDDPDALLSANLEEVLGPKNRKAALQALEQSTGGTQLPSPLNHGEPVYCTAHHIGDRLVFEFEQFSEGSRSEHLFQDMQEQLLDQASTDDLVRLGVEHVHQITGYEHVMVYRFHDNWDGEVVAEVVGEQLSSYIGHRFPASDIPRQARELYLKNPFRVIPDARYEPVSLKSLDDEPLDLSHAWLRSVSPVHLKYLENMGVQASLSISIIVEDRLWGLIACHHPVPRHVDPHGRRAAELYGRLFSVQLELRQTVETQQYISSHRDVYRLPHQFVGEDAPLNKHLCANGSKLLELVGAEGAAFSLYGKMETIGTVPAEKELEQLMRWLREKTFDTIWHTDHLAGIYPAAERIAAEASGVLAMKLPGEKDHLFVWFRPEMVSTVTWGGNPNKPVVREDGGGVKLSPRHSFESWTEMRRTYSSPWRPEHVEAGSDLRVHLVEAIVSEGRRRQNEQLGIIHRILGHDIRNSVGVVLLMSEMLSDKASPDVANLATRILKASRKITDLTRSLYAFSSLMKRSTRLDHERIDLLGILREQVEWTQNMHPDAVIDASDLESSPDGEYVVRGGSMLHSAFRNLIGNAIIHNDKETPRVVIQLKSQPSTVRVCIRDNGPGIPDTEKSKVFEEGYSRRKGEGTGLGLNLVGMIVDQYDGRITIADNQPEGAVFKVDLPRAPSQEASSGSDR